MLVTLFIVVTATFFMMQIMPGTPFNNPKLNAQQIAQLYATYGLDKPLWQQYLLYLKNAFTGNFGLSFQYTNQSVTTMIAQRLPVSAQLGLQSLIIGIILGIPMGVSSARHKNGFLDALFSGLSTLTIAIPSFVVAAFLLLIFGYTMQVLPVIGWDGMFTPSSWLPSIALSLGTIGSIARFVRTEMVESMTSDYIVLARAKGLNEREVFYGHALRNSLIPTLTLMGPTIAAVLTGSFLIESMFSIPGIGQLFVTSVTVKDFPVIMATTIVYALLLMGFILIFDVITAFVDPRVRLQ